MSVVKPSDPSNPALIVVGCGLCGALMGAVAGLIQHLGRGPVMAAVGTLGWALIGLGWGLAVGALVTHIPPFDPTDGS